MSGTQPDLASFRWLKGRRRRDLLLHSVIYPLMYVVHYCLRLLADIAIQPHMPTGRIPGSTTTKSEQNEGNVYGTSETLEKIRGHFRSRNTVTIS